MAQARSTGSAPAQKLLIDFSSPDASKQVSARTDPPAQGIPKGSTISVEKSGIVVNFLPHQPGDADHPGLRVVPAEGKVWDLSRYGHIEAKVTNTGTKTLAFVMQAEDGSGGLNNLESMNVKPGETRVLKIVFGYQYVYEAGATIDPSRISEIFIFMWGSPDPHAFRIEELKAAGVPGEKPCDPESVSHRPVDGVILGKGVAFDVARQVVTEGAQVSAAEDGELAVNFSGKDQAIRIKPPVGIWDLADGNEVRVRIRNTGKSATNPTLIVGSLQAKSREPIAPGAEAELALSFTGADTLVFDSSKVKEISLLSDGSRSLLIRSIVTDQAAAELPSWIGKRPPVEGDWVQSFDEEFDGSAINFSKWNIYGNNRLDGSYIWNRNHNQRRVAHFSKENVQLRDDKAILRFEKRSGNNNDAATSAVPTDYASGLLTTYGKWTQRYGYFEARIKPPRALSGVWASFTLMPDRGKAMGTQAIRSSTARLATDTGIGGAEFSVLDNFSSEGANRVNVGVRDKVDGKPLGSADKYVQVDKDGYLTIGLLWLPGSAVFYNNGKEVYRLENKRVGDVESYVKIFLITGGANNVNILSEDTKFPAEMTIDYVRAWQRKDLATSEDGDKQNHGDPDESKN
jgi:beta-glucanase (GH16 family)